MDILIQYFHENLANMSNGGEIIGKMEGAGEIEGIFGHESGGLDEGHWVCYNHGTLCTAIQYKLNRQYLSVCGRVI